MLDKMKYINGKGQTVLFGENNILVGHNDVRDFALNYATIYEVVANFSRGQATKKIPITIYGPDAYNIANNIYEIFMYDVIKNVPGKLVIGDYYMQGYIYASAKNVFGVSGIYKTTLSFVTDTNVWIKEVKVSGRTSEANFAGLDFPFDYSFEYYNPGASSIENGSLAPANFKLIAYGAGNSRISFTIGENMYLVNESLAENEIITIDTRSKSLTKTDANGNVTNVFSSRGKSSYIFEKIPMGKSSAYFDGFEWEATIYEERSEPKWI